jgi:glycolate oxidase iron-sulfur subunit
VNPRSETALAAALWAQEDRLMPCVHCGFCLPACPTYVRLGDENDSPRGRLYLMQAVVEGRLSPESDAFQTHIDRCLGCRACEPVCPSGVEYGVLLEAARETVYRARKRPAVVAMLLAVFSSRALTNWSMRVARVVRGLGLGGLVARRIPRNRLFHPIRFGLAMLEASRERQFGSETATGSGAPIASEDGALDGATSKGETSEGAPEWRAGHRGRVAILRGCVQAGLFARVNDATERVLRANGYEVIEVSGQGCCGALHTHAGDSMGARELARANVKALVAAEVDFVAVNAAGCGAALKEYGHLLEADEEYRHTAEALAASTRDISELLTGDSLRVGAPLPARVTYDAACHLCHAQGVRQEPLAVLGAIPELVVLPLQDAEECCGGAGIYGITHPELGGDIGADKVSAVLATGADIVATGNPGCMMQIGAELLLEGSDVVTCHPVELLDESYRRAGLYDGS